MVQHSFARTMLISLSNGARIDIVKENINTEIDPSVMQTADNRIRLALISKTVKNEYHSNWQMLKAYFTMISHVFMLDGYHSQMIFFLKNREMIQMVNVNAENVRQKYLIMRRVAPVVVTSGADAVIAVGEAWTARAAQLSPYQLPRDSPTKGEVLFAILATKNGELISIESTIMRDGENITLGPTREVESPLAFFLAPFYDAWGTSLPIPKS